MPTTPAADLHTLLNFEAQLNYAAKAILNDGGFTDVWRKGDQGVRPPAFTAVDVEIGEATGRLGIRPEGTQDHAHFSAILFVGVAVERTDNEPVDDGTGTPLDLQCAKIRALFLNHPNPFPRYTSLIEVHAIRPLAPVYVTGLEDAVDMRTLRWELMFTIPDSSWPAVSG